MTLSIRWVSRPGWKTAHAVMSWETWTAMTPQWSPCGTAYVLPDWPNFRGWKPAKPSDKPKCKACIRSLRGHLRRYERNDRRGIHLDAALLTTTAKIARLRRELNRIDGDDLAEMLRSDDAEQIEHAAGFYGPDFR